MRTLPESVVFVLCNSAQPCSSHETAYVAEDCRLLQHGFGKISIRAKKKQTFRKIVASEVSRTEVGNDYGSRKRPHTSRMAVEARKSRL